MQNNVDPIGNSCSEKTATETVRTSNASNCSRSTKSNLSNKRNVTVGLEHCSNNIIIDKITEPCDAFNTSLDEQVKYVLIMIIMANNLLKIL